LPYFDNCVNILNDQVGDDNLLCDAVWIIAGHIALYVIIR